jgi:hypothetical protein
LRDSCVVDDVVELDRKGRLAMARARVVGLKDLALVGFFFFLSRMGTEEARAGGPPSALLLQKEGGVGPSTPRGVRGSFVEG